MIVQNRTFRIVVTTIVCVVYVDIHCAAQLEFVDVSAACGILPSLIEPGMGTGAAAFDYDNDGDIDIYLPQGFGNPDRLYRNDGSGNFEDIAETMGMDVNLSGRSALWFDYDNDHLVDLLIATDCFNSGNPDCPQDGTIRLYRQLPSGQFENATNAAGLNNAGSEEFHGHRSALSCGDVDRDGDLDLVIGQWEGDLQLFINESGVFTDQAETRGITNPHAPFPYNPWQSVIHDFNGDGWPDIYTSVDFFENQFWLNQRDGTFVNVAESSGTNFAFNDMGVSVGDYDADGDFDIYVANIFEDGKHNLLLQNNSTIDNVQFEEVSFAAGVANTGFGWGSTFFDANNDTLLDLAVTNGWFNGVGYADHSKMYINNGDQPPTFTDVSKGAGFNDDYFGSCLLSADLNGDGDLDLLQTCIPSLLEGPFRVLENQLNEKSKNPPNWLVVRPRQADKNHWCLGAVVTVEIGAQRLCRSIGAGTSIHGQEPAEAAFGLGAATSIDRLIVKWPFGDETVWENIQPNQVFNALDADLNRNGSIEMADIFVLRQMMGPCDGECQADLNHDGQVNRLDVLILRSMLLRGSN